MLHVRLSWTGDACLTCTAPSERTFDEVAVGKESFTVVSIIRIYGARSHPIIILNIPMTANLSFPHKILMLYAAGSSMLSYWKKNAFVTSRTRDQCHHMIEGKV